jgi:hypothetical protein
MGAVAAAPRVVGWWLDETDRFLPSPPCACRALGPDGSLVVMIRPLVGSLALMFEISFIIPDLTTSQMLQIIFALFRAY